jgi:hypothetical protein
LSSLLLSLQSPSTDPPRTRRIVSAVHRLCLRREVCVHWHAQRGGRKRSRRGFTGNALFMLVRNHIALAPAPLACDLCQEVGHGVDHAEAAVQYAWKDSQRSPPGPHGALPRGGAMSWPLALFSGLDYLPVMRGNVAVAPTMQAHFGLSAPPYDDLAVVATPNVTQVKSLFRLRCKQQATTKTSLCALHAARSICGLSCRVGQRRHPICWMHSAACIRRSKRRGCTRSRSPENRVCNGCPEGAVQYPDELPTEFPPMSQHTRACRLWV